MNELEKMPLGTLDVKKRITQSFARNARTLIVIFLLFVVIVVMTTDIKLVTVTDIADLGLEFFLLLFVSYAMYLTCSGGGSGAGIKSDEYQSAVSRFNELKARILESDLQVELRDFCTYWVAEELKDSRMHYLAPVGFSYAIYTDGYANLSADELKAIEGLTKAQRKAISKANRVRPVKLTPEMILREANHLRHSRSPLGSAPALKKNVVFGARFIKMCVLTVGVSFIAMDVIAEPSWSTFASVCLKLVSVVLNGYTGYEDGYNNVVVDAVGYLNNQSDLIVKAMQYIKAHEGAALDKAGTVC